MRLGMTTLQIEIEDAPRRRTMRLEGTCSDAARWSSPTCASLVVSALASGFGARTRECGTSPFGVHWPAIDEDISAASTTAVDRGPGRKTGRRPSSWRRRCSRIVALGQTVRLPLFMLRRFKRCRKSDDVTNPLRPTQGRSSQRSSDFLEREAIEEIDVRSGGGINQANPRRSRLFSSKRPSSECPKLPACLTQ